MGSQILVGDCLQVMPTLPANSIDAIVTDPPYGLSFMGKDWDHGVPGVPFWVEALRVAKPGAHLLAFGGTRTFHRLTCAIEDAGWEVRDCLMWVYGSGFCKAGYVRGKDGEHVLKGFAGSLKPAWEPIILARKPVVGTVAANVMQFGTGAVNVDGCRVGAEKRFNPPTHKSASPAMGSFAMCNGVGTDAVGRWPANLIHDGSEEVTALLGDAARFFYCAKASKKDRDEGLTNEEREAAAMQGNLVSGQRLAGDGTPIATPRRKNHHPTVKPTDLMRYLCRLVTPPSGLILDPFAGSGSTGKAAALEGFQFIGIEKDAEFAEIAQKRAACGHFAGGSTGTISSR